MLVWATCAYKWVLYNLIKNNGRKWTSHPKSENVKVETEIKDKVNGISKIERVGKIINLEGVTTSKKLLL